MLVDEPDAATHQHHLTVTESMAQELLRIAGENQIGTNQVLTRIGQLVAGVKSAESYHQKFANWRRVLITLQVHGIKNSATIERGGDFDPFGNGAL